MKKTRILSLLLCLSLLFSVILPSTTAYAEDDTTSGMETRKTATANKDGSYTITLEAYATGEKTISTVTKDVPSDIVLVLDLSSSMNSQIGTVSYNTYSNKDNEALYSLRHNGGEGNLWYKDGTSYYSVSVTAEGRMPNYTDASSYTNSSLYNAQNNLYAKIGDDYVKVTVERSGKQYSYTYTYGGTTKSVSSSGNGTTPTFDSGVTLHVLTGVDSTSAIYTYTYTDSAGKPQTIITSTGGTTVPTGAAFYSRSTSTSGGGPRLDALQTACTNFAAAVADKCTTSDGKTVKHRIAVVGFNKSSTLYTGTSNADALRDMSTAAGQADVKNAITSLKTSQGTVPAEGLTTANDIFAANPISAGETRSRVVILFTDGYPSTSGADNFDSTLAKDAITQAAISKSTYGATVYSIAVIAGADPTSAGDENGTNPEKVNWYLHAVSSNKDGKPQTPSYYLSASDADSLNNIFQQISQQIETGGSSSTLTGEAVVKDIISPYFTLPEGATSDSITLKTYKYNGPSFNAASAWTENAGDVMGAKATIDGDKVNVTGFNFSENWCGTESTQGTLGNTTYRGNKLVISFKVVPKDGFLGGNDVITNTSAGVYENSSAQTPVITFEQPKVNVPIQDVTVEAKDKNIYLKSSVTAEQLKDGAAVHVGGVSLDLSKENYGLESWQTDYVNITVEITDRDGNAFTADDLADLTEDKEFTVKVTVAPKTATPTSKEGETAVEKSGSDTKNINVFKPVLTFKDSTAYYGETVSTDFSGNKVGTEKWMHGTTAADPASMIGTAPTLTVSCTPDSTKLYDNKYGKNDVPVSVTVKLGTEDVTSHTTFEHDTCSVEGCSWTAPIEKGSPAFLIHIRTCTLTINKTGGAANESYVFDVYKDGTKYSEVTIEGNTSQTLYELPIGNYTVQENTGWSWRYSADNGIAAIINAASPTGSITCTNSSNGKLYWLNGFSQVVRNIFVISH